MKRIAFLIAALLPAVLCSAQTPERSVWETKKSGWSQLTAEQRSQMGAFTEDYKKYLNVAKTSFLSSLELSRVAQQQGFAVFKDASQVKPGAKLLFPIKDRAVLLVVIGSEPIVNGSRVIGTHHDSPNIALKARPLYGRGEHALFNTVIHGGLKKYQWANLPLALVGRVDTEDGRRVDVSIGLKPGEPVFAIPDNAPHSDRDLRTRDYTNVLKGEEMDPIAGTTLTPSGGSVVANVVRLLGEQYNVKEEDLVSAELALVPVMQPADVGIDRSLIGSYGQDDRVSTYCAVRSLMDLKGTPKYTGIVFVSNFEESGSDNNTGAKSTLLTTTFGELVQAQRGKDYSDVDLRRALRNSQVLSSDANDGYNPIFRETSVDEPSAAKIGYGVTIKRYRPGFDANSEFTARIRGILDKNGIPWQTHTPKVELGTGGTIGGFMSQQEMEVIDIGIPLLSMHSPFEMASKVDVFNLYRFMSAFYQQ